MDFFDVASSIYFDVFSEREIVQFFENYFIENDYDEHVDELINSEGLDGFSRNLEAAVLSVVDEPPNKCDAAIYASSYLARKAVEGIAPPYEISSIICDEIEIKLERECRNEIEFLRLFSSYSSEYEDFNSEENISFYGKLCCQKIQTEIEDKIIDQCKKIIDESERRKSRVRHLRARQ